MEKRVQHFWCGFLRTLRGRGEWGGRGVCSTFRGAFNPDFLIFAGIGRGWMVDGNYLGAGSKCWSPYLYAISCA